MTISEVVIPASCQVMEALCNCDHSGVLHILWCLLPATLSHELLIFSTSWTYFYQFLDNILSREESAEYVSQEHITYHLLNDPILFSWKENNILHLYYCSSLYIYFVIGGNCWCWSLEMLDISVTLSSAILICQDTVLIRTSLINTETLIKTKIPSIW